VNPKSLSAGERIVDLPQVPLATADPLTDMEKAFSSMIEGNEEVSADVMDEYPEHWIG